MRFIMRIALTANLADQSGFCRIPTSIVGSNYLKNNDCRELPGGLPGCRVLKLFCRVGCRVREGTGLSAGAANLECSRESRRRSPFSSLHGEHGTKPIFFVALLVVNFIGEPSGGFGWVALWLLR